MVKLCLSLMTEPTFLDAAEPLLDHLDAVSWSPEPGWGRDPLSGRVVDVLSRFQGQGRLIGHSVTYSLLTAGETTPHHENWLRYLEVEALVRSYALFSTHFGFSVSGDAHRGAPLPVPLSKAALRTGQQRLRALARILECPVGVENLALAFSRGEALAQGRFVGTLVAAVDGFIVLDLHNLYCQVKNFDLDWDEILGAWPLDLVREIHVSGGSWSMHREKPIRRDTHDDLVPREILDRLPQVLARCPNCEFVTYERLGTTLSAHDITPFREDVLRLKEVIRR